MQKELLLAIGDDRSASYNLQFLKEVFDNFCDLKLTLFYVAPRTGARWMATNTPSAKDDDLSNFVVHTNSRGRKALEDAELWIREVAGCTEANIEIKFVQSRKGTVRELIDEARGGLYDAMLLGRKGFSWFEEVFDKSVCHEMLWQDIDFPLWICKRPPDNPHQNILLCMDGSDASLRMVDHASYMMAEEKKHTITLFYVAENTEDLGKSQGIFDSGLKILAENNVGEDRIELKTITAKNAVKATLKEATEGCYSAVGVGRHGANTPSKMEGMFPSSMSVNLLRQLTGSALWISK